MSLREVTRTCKGGLRPSDINVPREQEPVGQGLSADPAYMYTGIFVFAIAQGLLLQNWLAGWAGFVTPLRCFIL